MSPPDLARARRVLAAVTAGLVGHLEELAAAGVHGVPVDCVPPVQAARAGAGRFAPVLDVPRPAVEPAATVHPPRESLEQVRTDLGDCARCKLAAGRRTIVFGVGDPSAEIVFVGEGPGEDEDRLGEPFVGRAGQLLTRIIEDGMGLRRSAVYICNVVKCRPPGNRDPEPDEVAACAPFLARQLAAIAPKVIVALGRPAVSTLLGRPVAITKIRGQWQSYGTIPLMPTYHPAYVLRKYTPEVRREVWDDVREVLRRLGRPPPQIRSKRGEPT